MKYDELARMISSQLDSLDGAEKVDALNEVREIIHQSSPFKSEPVDLIRWVYSEDVQANDYNPNSVAPPEMELLRISINNDGYTQPIVTWVSDTGREVIDGFHRTKVCKEFKDVRERVMGFLPVVTIKDDNTDRNSRIASTIRHNRARGKHRVDSMSDIVIELKNRNWKNTRIAKELGMEEDEILRLCQITGLSDLFSDEDFSKSWEVDGLKDDFVPLDDSVCEEDGVTVRTVNTSDTDRVFHTWDKWECYQAGFYATTKEGMSKTECEEAYATFLSDTDKFADALKHVISEWKLSCEHYLTNAALNRIAWLGQASMCYATGVPSEFRAGFSLLSEKQQLTANETALVYLNKWLKDYGLDEVELDAAVTDRQSTLY
jgi:ParB-like chromosome segregation protein Spo0J